jgi:glycosyltransferase involved in cell wall biosynthesis
LHLILITQKIDESDDILGFTGHWLRSLARHVDQLTCLALTTGDFPNPPSNVTLRSLNKETHPHRWRLALALEKELAHAGSSHPVDAILAHMAPVYAVLSYPISRWYGAPIYLWYTHRAVDSWLRMGTAVSSLVFSAAKESFRLPTPKLRVVGHGIPLEHFHQMGPGDVERTEILAVGRISPVKKLDVLIRAMSLLPKGDLRLRIVGDEAVALDRAYRADLDKLIEELGMTDRVVFDGSVPYTKIPSCYARALLSVAPSAQSFDKTVLESMASGCVSLTANPAFAPLLGADTGKLLYHAEDARELASKIQAVVELPEVERTSLAARLRRSVAEAHGLDRLTERIVKTIAEDAKR